MLYIFGVFVLASLIGISFKHIKGIDITALNHDRTLMINGFFVGLILFSHFNGYVKYTNNLDNIYLKIILDISQLMVTTFLFYSGYGILESIKNKPNYIKGFFKNRILKLLIMFDIAVALFIILNIIIGKNYSIKTTLLAFTGWNDIGNSNWFIFATFVLYLFVLISFSIFKKDNLKGILLTLFLTTLYMFILVKFRIKAGIWYNTILCFNAGMFVSYYKEKIIEFLKDNYRYVLLFLIFVLIFLMCHLQGYNYIVYLLKSIVFTIIIMMLSMKIKIGNRLLLFLGKYTFSIYILQRISFIAYRYIGLSNYNIYIYFGVSVITTIIMAVIYTKVLNLLFKITKLSN